jgi:hypothetical protein
MPVRRLLARKGSFLIGSAKKRHVGAILRAICCLFVRDEIGTADVVYVDAAVRR